MPPPERETQEPIRPVWIDRIEWMASDKQET